MTPSLPTVFTAADAIAAGVSRNQLQRGAYPHVFWGVYTTGDATDVSVRALAALRVAGPKALLGGVTALKFLSVWLPTKLQEDDHIYVNLPPGMAGPQTPPIIVTRSKVVLEPMEFWDVLGLMGVHPAQAWLQAANQLNLTDLVVATDALMRRQYTLVVRSEFEYVLSCFPGRRGVKRARQALQMAHAGVDSPMETYLRLALIAAKLPCPEVNLPVRPQPEGRLYYLDMAYPQAKLAVEYDGTGHVKDSTQMQRDRTRRREIEDAGWRIITATNADAPDWTRVIESVRAALSARSGI